VWMMLTERSRILEVRLKLMMEQNKNVKQ